MPEPDLVGEKIRQLQQYDEVEDDIDTDVTGDHNIVAMPGSHVTVTADALKPQKKSIPLWAKIVASIVGAGVAAAVKAWWDATH